jgi:hypothetical protein
MCTSLIFATCVDSLAIRITSVRCSLRKEQCSSLVRLLGLFRRRREGVMSLGQRVMSHGCSYRGGALGEGVLVARAVEAVEVDGGVIARFFYRPKFMKFFEISVLSTGSNKIWYRPNFSHLSCSHTDNPNLAAPQSHTYNVLFLFLSVNK